jgi:DNA-binding HxlR family transcriptional regulator/putative sterol carrier protein
MSRDYRQFCGLARALELVGGRWALLVVRDLLTGPKRFSELQEGLRGIPTNVLTSRLRELGATGIVQRRAQARPGSGVVYELTDYGHELEEAVLRLGYWGAKTMGAPKQDDFISTDALALALRGAFRPDKARGAQRTYELRTAGKPLRIAIENGQVTVPAVTDKDPDLVVEAAPEVFSQLFGGTLNIDAARTSHRLRVQGDDDDLRRLFEMFRFPSTDNASVHA